MSITADKTNGLVGVVLVNWNGGEYTIRCIESLLAGIVKPDKIVVVDNASQDGSPDQIARLFPTVDLIRNSENLGFTGANNIGIRRLMDGMYNYIWILNNDTIVAVDCLAVLKDHMSINDNVAACTGKILYAEPPDVLWYAGASYSRWEVRSRHRGNGEHDTGRYNIAVEVPFLSGCCMFIRSSAVAGIGLFNDRFFAYAEDDDWCHRAQRAGLRLDYVPGAILWHKVAATIRMMKPAHVAGLTSPFSVYIINRNRLFLIRLYGEGILQRTVAVVSLFIRSSAYGAALLLLGRWEKFKALALGLWDGLRLPTDFLEQNAPKPRYLR